MQVKLLHISDLHYRMQYKSSNKAFAYDSIFPNMVPPMQQLDICLQKMGEKEREQLSAVLISGDMTEYGTQEDYKQLHTEIEKRFPDIPIIVTPGNHDERQTFQKGWLGWETVKDEPYCYIRRLGSVSILSMDHSYPGSADGKIGWYQCDWLKKALESEKGQAILLMTHHHLLPRQAEFPACEVTEGFNEILRRSSISMILCGHTHQLYRGFYENIPYRTAMSLSFVGEDQEQRVCMRGSCGYSLYEFDNNNGILIRERHEALGTQEILGYVKF